MRKVWKNLIAEGNGWRKLANPTVARGKTVFPQKPIDQQRYGVRFDYDGVVTKDGNRYHKYQIQPNSGDGIPSTIKSWKNAHGGTHSVMTNVFVKKDGTKTDVRESLEEALSDV